MSSEIKKKIKYLALSYPSKVHKNKKGGGEKKNHYKALILSSSRSEALEGLLQYVAFENFHRKKNHIHIRHGILACFFFKGEY